jgi:hypothetical protein
MRTEGEKEAKPTDELRGRLELYNVITKTRSRHLPEGRWCVSEAFKYLPPEAVDYWERELGAATASFDWTELQLSSSNIRTSGNSARISSTITARRRGSSGSSFREIKVETEKTVSHR